MAVVGKSAYEKAVESEWIYKANTYLSDCKFPEYTLYISIDSRGAAYLRGSYLEKDTITGNVEVQQTRRWFLSPEMLKSEIVATAFKCVMTSMEHRTREWFTYKNKAIYMPHYDVDELHKICEERTRQ